MTKTVRSEDAPEYGATKTPALRKKEDAVIRQAMGILEGRMRRGGDVLTSPDSTRDFLTLALAGLEHEVFTAIFLNNKHRVIQLEHMFRGTIDGANVYPREVVKAALACNAAAVIFAHNHPSGEPEPSRADITITKRLKDALALVDVRVLDHIIVGGMEQVSLAERGQV